MPDSVRRITVKYRPVLPPPGPCPAVLPAPRLTAVRAAASAGPAAVAAAAGVAINVAAAAITHAAPLPVRSRRDVPCRSCMKTPSTPACGLWSEMQAPYERLYGVSN